MKEINPKQLPAVSGGELNDGGGCVNPPRLPGVPDYPRTPTIPYFDDPTDPTDLVNG